MQAYNLSIFSYASHIGHDNYFYSNNIMFISKFLFVDCISDGIHNSNPRNPAPNDDSGLYLKSKFKYIKRTLSRI